MYFQNTKLACWGQRAGLWFGLFPLEGLQLVLTGITALYLTKKILGLNRLISFF